MRSDSLTNLFYRHNFFVERARETNRYFTGAIFTGVLLIDDLTVIGAADDPLLAGSTVCFVGGINGIFGKKVCTECGEVRYGY